MITWRPSLALALALSSLAAHSDEVAPPRPLSVTELKERYFDDVEAYFANLNKSVEVRGVVVELQRCPPCPPGTKCDSCKDHFVVGEMKGGPRLEVCGLPNRPAKPGRDPRPGEVVRVTGTFARHGGGCPERGTFGVLTHEKTLDAEGRRVLLEGSDFVATVERPVDVQFREAVKAGDVSRATALLDQGADIESKSYLADDPPLGYAAGRGDVPMIELLLRRGARLEAQGDRWRTPLLTAIVRGKEAAVSLLLRAGANPNAVDFDGEPAIVLAADKGTAEMARMLLAKGADKDARIVSGSMAKSTALLNALESRNTGVAKALIEAGADVKAVGSIGETPLHACSESPPEVCAALLARGAVLEAKTPQGNTPLMSAAQDGNVAVVQLLLARGADPNARNAQGKTALQLAEEGAHVGAIEVLKPRTRRP